MSNVNLYWCRLCRYVRNIGLNKFMSTVEKATVTPHSSKTGETAVLKQVCDLGTDCCWWLAVASCCCLAVADPCHSDDPYPSFHFDAHPDPTFHFLYGSRSCFSSKWCHFETIYRPSTPPLWSSTVLLGSIFSLPAPDFVPSGSSFQNHADTKPHHWLLMPCSCYLSVDALLLMLCFLFFSFNALHLMPFSGCLVLNVLLLITCGWCRAVDVLV